MKRNMLDNIKIGAFNYKVVLEESELDGDACDGLMDYAQAKISISNKQDDQIKVQTLLHEILHGIMHQAGYIDHDEGVINTLSYGLIQVIRDNPELYTEITY